MDDSYQKMDAENDFYLARRREILSSLFMRLRGESADLLSFEEVKKLLKPTDESYKGSRTIKIADIVGSEGRYQDFNRLFLPKNTGTRVRWQSISEAHVRGVELPAIRVYELGGIYFVRDGNHRVSVAKQRGVEFIEAEVTSLTPKIKVGAVRDRDELKQAVIEHERKEFINALNLIDGPPQSTIRFSATGRYDDLVVHISCHKYVIEQRTDSQISYQDAAQSWFDVMYLPMSKFIRDSGVLEHLPSRTEADCYVWLIRHWDDVDTMVLFNPPRRRWLRRRFVTGFADGMALW